MHYLLPSILLALSLSACTKLEKPLPSPSTADLKASAITREGDLLKIDYQGFSVWLDCNERAPVKFRYNAQRDSGTMQRDDTFRLDRSVPRECQQLTTAAYGNGFDRGQQVPANHLDYSPIAIKQSNFMTNILPQVSQMNRGAWVLTEEIIECYVSAHPHHLVRRQTL